MHKRHTIKTSFSRLSGERPANRWAEWAQTLYDRHARITVRSRALAVVLAGNRSTSLRVVERRYFAPVNFFSQIRLSIAPVLRGLNREVKFLLSESKLKEHARLASIFTRERSERDRYQTERLLQSRRDFYYMATPAASAQTIVQQLSSDHYTSAFFRIFNRFMVNRSPESTLRRNEAAGVGRAMDLIKRIVTTRNRLEEHVRHGLVTRVHRETTRATEQIISERTLSGASLSRNPPPAPWVNQNGSPVDIEQLTEQVVRNIDGRIVAHRERVGKLF